jgi:hypothetical protein
VFHGKGGYDWGTVYNMPIWLRNYTFRSIQEFYDKEAEAQEEANRKAQGIQQASSANMVARPGITPNYTMKAPTKK